MSTTSATAAIPGSGAGAPAANPRTAAPDDKIGRLHWWRFASRPMVLAGAFLLLAMISAASTVFIIVTQSNSEWVTHTLEVEYKLSNLRVLIRAAESSERGYLLTGSPAYLSEFQSLAAKILPAFAGIKEATADNPVQQQALAELGPLILRRFNAMENVMRLHDSGHTADAVALLGAERSLNITDEIGQINVRMTDEERRLLELRTANSASSNLLLLAIEVGSTALMIALAGVSILAVRRIGAEALRESQKRGDELQAAVEELDAFSYSVSHDLRTPLRAIDGFSRILLKHHAAQLAQEPREYLQAVRDNTLQMGHLVDDLLAFARINRKQINKQLVQTKPLVEQVVSEIARQAEGRSVKVSVGELPPVMGDAALLKQVFVNLIDNAFKYTRHSASATVEIGTCDVGGEQAFFVRDNGVGFDMNYADRLFGVFQRLHRAEDFEGTGVGLAIVQRIIHRHGGRVWADAALDKGATFYFTMETPVHE